MELSTIHAARQARVRNADSGSFDVVIIGGGIHGASAAREAAMRGFSVLLLEARDFAYGTSSRSSKLLHGGVRYLEQGALMLLYEGLQERGRMLWQAPHLSRPLKMLFPTVDRRTRPAWQVGLGLGVYDRLARLFGAPSREHFPPRERLTEQSPEWQLLEQFGTQFNGLFLYHDAQMDDARLVIETVVDAAELGAVVLNHARVTTCRRVPEGAVRWRVGWIDQREGTEHEAKAGFVLNLSGPWVREVQSAVFADPYSHWRSNWPLPIFSRGTHLLFDRPWPYPGLILPTDTKGRVYFVLPYFNPYGEATLLGTTDVLTDSNEDAPEPSVAEVEELLALTKRDIPQAELDTDAVFGSFAGMRVLAGQSRLNKRSVSNVSREDVFLEYDYCLALLGGKFTTARRTAEKIITRMTRLSGISAGATSTRLRPLPGGEGWTERGAEALIRRLSEDAPNLRPLAERAVQLFGMRAERLLKPYRPRTPREFILNKINYLMLHEFAETEADILRRLSLDKAPPGAELAREEILSVFRGLGENTAPRAVQK